MKSKCQDTFLNCVCICVCVCVLTNNYRYLLWMCTTLNLYIGRNFLQVFCGAFPNRPILNCSPSHSHIAYPHSMLYLSTSVILYILLGFCKFPPPTPSPQLELKLYDRGNFVSFVYCHILKVRIVLRTS